MASGGGGGGSMGLALAGAILGAAGVVLALVPKGRDRPAGGEDADLLEKASLEGRIADLEKRAEAGEKRLAEAAADAAAARQAAQEAKAAAAGAMEAAGRSPTVQGGPPAAGEKPAGEGKDVPRGTLADLLRQVEAGTVPLDDLWETLDRIRELGGIDDAMKALEKRAADRPQDADAQYALGTAYLQKLLSVPDGPERGKWSMKAIGSYDAALKVDPEHWAARFSKAMNYSQWPDFLGKQPEAIREFETLIQQQERKPPEPHFAQTYYMLGNTYRKAGNLDKAREVFQRGLSLFPDNQQLKQQVDLLDKR